ncbi:MAG: DUF362 domain-containing protein [Nanoarchaeota archaeon]|nr:DUF362 domain-containing protein [Nanoarchaeota archaeon]
MSLFTRKERELVGIVKPGSDLNKPVKKYVKKAVDLIGGFGKLVEKGDTIVVKPNFNTDDAYPGSSDPDFVKAVIELLYEAGAGKVILAEDSYFRVSTRKNLENTGMLRKALEAGAEVIVLREGKWVTVDVDGKYMKQFHVGEIFTKEKKIVYLPCIKTHFLGKFTMSLKLPMGLIRYDDRIKMHLRALNRKIADLNIAVRPSLIIMDGRKCFITRGPRTGEVREPGLILVSGDQIAIDIEAIKVIQSFEGNNLAGVSPWSFDQIRWAMVNKIGVGSEKEYYILKG